MWRGGCAEKCASLMVKTVVMMDSVREGRGDEVRRSKVLLNMARAEALQEVVTKQGPKWFEYDTEAYSELCGSVLALGLWSRKLLATLPLGGHETDVLEEKDVEDAVNTGSEAGENAAG